jgi:hypothetical protein
MGRGSSDLCRSILDLKELVSHVLVDIIFLSQADKLISFVLPSAVGRIRDCVQTVEDALDTGRTFIGNETK